MSEIKHTEGPWWIAGKGTIRCGWPGSIRAGWIANVNWRNREANARLIAAAPELLDALENLLAAHSTDAPECVFARAAIAKAKGTA